MAPPQAETAAVTKVPPEQVQQEKHPMSRSEVAPAGEPQQGTPPANFSEAIDRIGLGPFQTRLVIMCGMVRARCRLLYIAKFYIA